MNQSTTDILQMICRLGEIQNMRVAIETSGKAGAVSGLCTLAGGLLGGKMGMTFGGLAATALTSLMVQEDFKTVGEVIREEMDDSQKENLANLIKSILQVAPIPTAASGLLGDPNIRDGVVSTVLGFVQNMGYKRPRSASSSCYPARANRGGSKRNFCSNKNSCNGKSCPKPSNSSLKPDYSGNCSSGDCRIRKQRHCSTC